jgi:hypothetical protein
VYGYRILLLKIQEGFPGVVDRREKSKFPD